MQYGPVKLTGEARSWYGPSWVLVLLNGAPVTAGQRLLRFLLHFPAGPSALLRRHPRNTAGTRRGRALRLTHIHTLLLLTVVAAAFPTSALAQAAIAGVVKDASGGAIPGVLVEASSPALIEKTRTAVSDGAGRYRLEDLRPGIYAVRFTGKGWRPFQQAGVELTGSFTATVNVELAVGPVTEAITVTADVPAVDVHNAEREVALSGELVRSIPTVRSYNALLVLVPGVVTNFNDTVTGTATTSFPIHGGRAGEGRLMLDGLTVGSPPVGNSATSYVIDVGQAQEVTFATTGALGEAETGGLVMNIVPRSGGNTPHGSLFTSVTGANLQGDNLTQSLKDQGVTGRDAADRRLRFLGRPRAVPSGRTARGTSSPASLGGSRREVPNVFYNVNAGDPARWLYAPDYSRREYSDRKVESLSGRLTWQLTPRHRITAFLDAQALCRTCTGATAGAQEPARVSPEAVGPMRRPLTACANHMAVAPHQSTSPRSGYGGTYFTVGNLERVPNPTRDLIRVAEQCASGCAANGNIPGLVYRSQDFSVQRRVVPLEGVGVLRDGQPQPEARLSAHVHDRRPDVVHEQPEPDVSLQRRRAEPVDPDRSRRG